MDISKKVNDAVSQVAKSRDNLMWKALSSHLGKKASAKDVRDCVILVTKGEPTVLVYRGKEIGRLTMDFNREHVAMTFINTENKQVMKANHTIKKDAN